MKTSNEKSDVKVTREIDLDFSNEIELEIAKIESQIKSQNQKAKPLYIFLALMLFGAIAFLFFGQLAFEKAGLDTLSNKTPLISLATIAYVILLGAMVIVLRSTRMSSLNRDLDMLKAKKRIISRTDVDSLPKGQLTYFDRLVEINISNLDAYYRLVKDHTNNSFLSSIIAGAVGFILIATGLIIGFTSIQESKYIAYISAGSGVLTEFIASIFFYLYNRTVRQLKEYHDSLIDVQNILLAFKIVGDSTDEKQTSLMELMLQYLMKMPNKANAADAKSRAAD